VARAPAELPYLQVRLNPYSSFITPSCLCFFLLMAEGPRVITVLKVELVRTSADPRCTLLLDHHAEAQCSRGRPLPSLLPGKSHRIRTPPPLLRRAPTRPRRPTQLILPLRVRPRPLLLIPSTSTHCISSMSGVGPLQQGGRPGGSVSSPTATRRRMAPGQRRRPAAPTLQQQQQRGGGLRLFSGMLALALLS
jgi:hypothetical protein